MSVESILNAVRSGILEQSDTSDICHYSDKLTARVRGYILGLVPHDAIPPSIKTALNHIEVIAEVAIVDTANRYKREQSDPKYYWSAKDTVALYDQCESMFGPFESKDMARSHASQWGVRDPVLHVALCMDEQTKFLEEEKHRPIML